MKRIFRRIGPVLRFVFLSLLAIVLYEIVLKPILPHLRDFFLDVTSLGIQAEKDKTYLAIAKGFHESSSLAINRLLMVFLSYFFVCVSVYLVVNFRRTREGARKLIREIEAVEEEQKSENDLKEKGELIQRLIKWLMPFAYLALFLGVVALGIAFVRSSQYKYINSAVTHYRQVLNICDPYLNDSDKKRIVSTFAQIRKKEHYVAVIKELEKIATEKGQYVPKFEAW